MPTRPEILNEALDRKHGPWVASPAIVTKQYINLPDSNFLTRQLTDLFADNIESKPRILSEYEIPSKLYISSAINTSILADENLLVSGRFACTSSKN